MNNEVEEMLNRRKQSMLKIAERIDTLRKERGWTLVELANKAGISYSYLFRLFKGERFYSFETSERLARALGITLGRLLGIEEFDDKNYEYIYLTISEMKEKLTMEQKMNLIQLLSTTTKDKS